MVRQLEVVRDVHARGLIQGVAVLKALMELKPLCRTSEYPTQPLDGAIETALEEAVNEALLWKTSVAAQRRAMAEPPK
jgi:hypothetical protein